MPFRISSIFTSRPRPAALLVVAALAAMAAACSPSDNNGGLPALGADINETSVSGISSGAYMAGQFEMAEAKIVKGAAIIAGGPYGCSQSIFADTLPAPGTEFLNLSKAVNGCMLNNLSMFGVADPEGLAAKAKDRASKNQIGSIADVTSDRVYLFSGESDRTVVPAIVKAAAKYYAALGVPQTNIKLVDTLPAGHAFVTETQGAVCERSGEPYVVDCDYDQAGDLLRFIYGDLQPKTARPEGDWLEFDQRPYLRDLGTDGMADTGVVYVPQSCRATRGCRIHVAFHGCAQNRQKVGDVFVKETGFANWADTNRLIVLFPQTTITPFNPQACWDWWGYTGPKYLTRDAPQIIAVRRMLDKLAGS